MLTWYFGRTKAPSSISLFASLSCHRARRQLPAWAAYQAFQVRAPISGMSRPMPGWLRPSSSRVICRGPTSTRISLGRISLDVVLRGVCHRLKVALRRVANC